MTIETIQAARVALAALNSIARDRILTVPNVQPAVAVFGRYCSRLAGTVAQIVQNTCPTWLVISGKKGKDSGPLPQLGIAEAHYVVSVADGLMNGRLLGGSTKVLLDLDATDGLENAANMVALLKQRGFTGGIVVVAHRTQLVRLALTFEEAANKAGMPFGKVYWHPSSYFADIEELRDQWEIFFEIVRILELAEQGHLILPDLPTAVTDEAHRYLAVVQAELLQRGTTNFSTAGWL